MSSGGEIGIFQQWAPIYRERGFWPRPISHGSKGCRIQGWQRPDPDIPAEERASRLYSHARSGIGLVMGSPLPDGTVLGALDIDTDDYVGLGKAILREPPCGRIGKKGAVFFVRVAGQPRNAKLKPRGDKYKHLGHVAEWLIERKLCVIPPTFHPETLQPYRWIGSPLHEIDFTDLPVVEM